MSREIDPENMTPEDVEYVRVRPLLQKEFIAQGYGDPLAEDYPGLVDSEPDDEGDEGEDEESPDYESMKKDELIQEAEERGLDASGNKSDLIARLMADDEDGETESE